MRHCRLRCFAILLLLVLSSAAFGQTSKAVTAPKPVRPQKGTQSPGQAATPASKFTPELLKAFSHLYEKLQSGVQYPPTRSASRLLPLMPESTVFYAAIPNYGTAAQQALDIFHAELQQSPVLRDWWTEGDAAGNGTKLEDAVGKFRQLAEYLGDEIVLSANLDHAAPNMLLVSEIRKSGLKLALQRLLKDESPKSTSGIRLLDAKELAGAEDAKPVQDLVIVVRPDYLVAAHDIATLRAFNARLDANSRGFVATGFGQRVARAYQDGVTLLAAADLQAILTKATSDSKQQLGTVQRTGFGDVQYMVWEHTNIGGQDMSESELSFTGPRHGMAAWLGAPSQLHSLEFVSPKAVMAWALVLANPSQMFDDLRELATSANPKAFDPVAQMEQQYKISFQQDLLQQLAGELTIEVDSITAAGAVWKVILKANDPVRLQQTITTLLAAQKIKPERFEAAGLTYYKVNVPSAKTPTEIAYTFVDGYLVIASSPDTATEAVRLHRSGDSLGKSPRFLASLPPGHPEGVSGLIYQDPIAVASIQAQQLSPEMAASVSQLSTQSIPPAVMVAYGEENAIRGASTSTTMDAGVVLVMAAIAIPNLLRSRVAANEASAVGALRTINTAQAAYAATYADRGFAPDLATLGTVAGSAPSAEHAGLIDPSLGCSNPVGWCEKSGFRFRVTAVCLQQQCPQYVAMAAPIDASSGNRNFCSTSDAVIRFKVGPPLTSPIRAAECKSWPSLQ